jgi:hypothetical protein
MAKSEKGFDPSFDNGGYWEYYKDLERQFENFLDYVPYLEGNENTYSFRLANMILAIGGHIDSVLKKIAEEPSFSSKYPEMLNPKVKKGEHKGGPRDQELIDYYPISEEYKLYEKIVVFKCLPNREEISPFKEYRKELGKVPYWWTKYNGIKHQFSVNFKEANLKTVRDALAGAFLLNVIHDPAADRLARYKLLTPKYAPRGFQLIYDKFRGKSMHPIYVSDLSSVDPFFIETSLFKYDYEKVETP